MNKKIVLLLFMAAAVLGIVSHLALSRHPVEMFLVMTNEESSSGKAVPAAAFHLSLFLNGREPQVETIRLDASQGRRAVQIVKKRDLRGLMELACETGDFRFVAAVQGTKRGWPWYLHGSVQEDAVSNLHRLDPWCLYLFSGTPGSPEYVKAGAEEAPTAAATPSNLHPEDWVESHPLNRSTPTPSRPIPAVRVEILNDCGIKGAADDVARVLERPGIEIVFVGNTPKYRYRSTRVQSSVGIPVVLQEILERMGIPEKGLEEVPSGRRNADVSVIVGRDYRKILERMNARTID